MAEDDGSPKTEARVAYARAVPDPNFELKHPRVYSNLVTIHSTRYDFTLRFCDALPMYEPVTDQTDKPIEIKIPIKAEIIIPKEMFPVMVRAMQDHYNKHMQAEATSGSGS